jgi:hypothetical protein
MATSLPRRFTSLRRLAPLTDADLHILNAWRLGADLGHQ